MDFRYEGVFKVGQLGSSINLDQVITTTKRSIYLINSTHKGIQLYL